MRDYSEKRDFPRMAVECEARYRVIDSGERGSARVHDLSAGGALLHLESELQTGARLALEIRPQSDITPPLQAELEVIRCDAREPCGYAAACTIVRMLSETEAGPGFV